MTRGMKGTIGRGSLLWYALSTFWFRDGSVIASNESNLLFILGASSCRDEGDVIIVWRYCSCLTFHVSFILETAGLDRASTMARKEFTLLCPLQLQHGKQQYTISQS